MNVHPDRTRNLNDCSAVSSGAVVYWMQRDQRAEENWALLYAQATAQARGVPLVVVFNLVTTFGGATFRHFDFMLRGLEETAAELGKKNIPFVLLQGSPEDTIVSFVKKHSVGELVCDFNPLRFTQAWRKSVATLIPVKMTEVDARNIVPCWKASEKQEYAAYTFRPRIHRQLKDFLTTFPALETQTQVGKIAASKIDWAALRQNIEVDREVAPVDWLTPGTQAAKMRAQEFISQPLDQYSKNRNDPNKQGVSHMSPYLHFGQVSAQWLAYQVNNATDADPESRDAYLEELIVRRELTDNYCFYNADYDKVEGAHAWAQKTIAEHAGDEREYTYQRKELETAGTHDELWNAMQRQMVTTGKMHGWCRMYWAKKILEWSDNTQMAIDRALYLNDKYELDGNDPNGVVGVMWSICGVHDRAWNIRPIFGKIRYMNFNGAKRKFDVQAFVDKYSVDNTLFDE
jgi:deoxyribodipyrimidine photo-lyase